MSPQSPRFNALVLRDCRIAKQDTGRPSEVRFLARGWACHLLCDRPLGLTSIPNV